MEAAVAAGVFLVAALVGGLYTNFQDRPPQFFQEWFAPAVLLASGHGYTNVEVASIPELAAFLDAGQPRDAVFDATVLPETLPAQPLNAFQVRHRYLLTAVALCFALLGMAWSSLWPLYGLLYGTSAVAAYGIFRRVMGRGFALLCVAMLITSPLHLMKLPGLRDYSKAPFILLAILLMTVLLTRPMKLRGHLLAGAAAGLVVGLGVGFRIDVLIVIVPLLAVWMVFPAGRWRETVRPRLAGLGLFVFVLLLSGGAILFSLGEGGNKSHPALLGFADRFDGRLELEMPPYDLQHTFYDAEVMLKLQAFEEHRAGEAPPLDYETPEYERIADGYYATVLRAFPADFAIRALAAVPGVVEGLRPGRTYPVPAGITAPALQPLYTLRYGVERVLLWRPLYMIILLLLAVSAVALRPAFGWCFLALFFTGYTAVQFSTRHSFQLEFLPLLIGGAFYQRVVWAVLRLWRSGLPAALASATRALRLYGGPGLARVTLFSAVVMAGLFEPLCLLRAYQQARVLPLLETYATAPRTHVPFSTQAGENSHTLLIPQDLPADPEPSATPVFGMRYLALTFDTTDGPANGTVVYTGAVADNDLSLSFHVPQSDAGPVTVALPVFRARLATENDEWVRFEGIGIGPSAHLLQFEAYDDPFQFPFYMTLTPRTRLGARPSLPATPCREGRQGRADMGGRTSLAASSGMARIPHETERSLPSARGRHFLACREGGHPWPLLRVWHERPTKRERSLPSARGRHFLACRGRADIPGRFFGYGANAHTKRSALCRPPETAISLRAGEGGHPWPLLPPVAKKVNRSGWHG